VLHIIIFRSAADANHLNEQESFKSDVQDSLNLLGKKPSFAFKNIYPKYNSRNFNDDVSARIRSKVDYTDQKVGN
jgi:hypothetical protein